MRLPESQTALKIQSKCATVAKAPISPQQENDDVAEYADLEEQLCILENITVKRERILANVRQRVDGAWLRGSRSSRLPGGSH